MFSMGRNPWEPSDIWHRLSKRMLSAGTRPRVAVMTNIIRIG
jgi:hypothetical protein